MQNEADAFRILRHAMSALYTGRRFVLLGQALAPDQAFDERGALPLFAARAARRFRIVHPNGVAPERCLRCGRAAPPSTGVCHVPCPRRENQDRVRQLFWFDLPAAHQPDALLPVRVRMHPWRASVFLSLYFVMDAAQELLAQSPKPREIVIDDLSEDLGLALEADLKALAPERPDSPQSETATHGHRS